jgi:hypothetical protein
MTLSFEGNIYIVDYENNNELSEGLQVYYDMRKVHMYKTPSPVITLINKGVIPDNLLINVTPYKNKASISIIPLLEENDRYIELPGYAVDGPRR